MCSGEQTDLNPDQPNFCQLSFGQSQISQCHGFSFPPFSTCTLNLWACAKNSGKFRLPVPRFQFSIFSDYPPHAQKWLIAQINICQSKSDSVCIRRVNWERGKPKPSELILWSEREECWESIQSGGGIYFNEHIMRPFTCEERLGSV